MPKQYPDPERLRQLFTYDPHTGDLIWKERALSEFPSVNGGIAWNNMFAGKVAGAKCYQRGKIPHAISIWISGTPYKAHRIIMLMMEVDMPQGTQVDHIDGNSFNNRWGNLRKATNAQNNANKRVIRNNRDLPRGVTRTGRRFEAMIRANNKEIMLGKYATPELAHQAYLIGVMKYHGEFAFFAGRTSG